MPARATDPTRSAHAILNLAAVGRNAHRISGWVPGAKLMAVIKANAYGHGLLRIARSLPAIDAFAVARTAEGLALREGGICQRIAVLQGFTDADELESHRSAGLEPVIHSPWQVDLLEQAPPAKPLRIWLKLDTGMHRLGLMADQVGECLRRLEACPSVAPEIPLMSHLASADDLEDPQTSEQLARFEAAACGAGETSLANSAGLMAWERTRLSWVRPGITLYGVSPFPDRSGVDEGLEPVMTFRSRLISIKQLEPGAKVGYGGSWICPQRARLGIVAVGYGDGYPRHAESGTPVLIRGQRLPLVGRVSMDMISVDVTHCPEARVGDPVTLWGDGLPVEEIARCAHTIAYELLCGVTARVRIIETDH